MHDLPARERIRSFPPGPTITEARSGKARQWPTPNANVIGSRRWRSFTTTTTTFRYYISVIYN